MKQVFGLVSVVLISKLVGLAREMVIADRFGTSSDYDQYLIAVMLPALAWGVISFASYYFFVPHLTKIFGGATDSDAEQSWRSTWPLFNITAVGALGVTLLLLLIGPYLLPIWAKGYQNVDLGKVIFYGRVTAGIVLLGATEAFLRALLNVRGIFSYPAWGLIVCNVVMIGTTLWLAPSLGAGAVAIGVLAGFVGQNLFLLVRMVTISKASWRWGLKLPTTTFMLATGSLLVAVELLNPSYFLIDRYFAAPFGEGIISALNYGQVLAQLPDAIVGFSIASVMFPLFSENRATEENLRFGQLYHEAVIGGLMVAIPTALFVFLSADDLVSLLFSRGEFDATSVTTTASLLKPYTPAIAALFLMSTSLRACYALGLARHVLFAAACALALKFASTALLSAHFGSPGISMATTLAQVGFAVSLFALVLTKVPKGSQSALIIDFGKIIMAGAVSLAIVCYLDPTSWWDAQHPTQLGQLVRVGITGAFVFGVFLLLSLMLGLKKYITKVIHVRSN